MYVSVLISKNMMKTRTEYLPRKESHGKRGRTADKQGKIWDVIDIAEEARAGCSVAQSGHLWDHGELWTCGPGLSASARL